MHLSPDVTANVRELVSLRRSLHRIPEPGFKERRTAQFIRAKLRQYGVEHRPLCGTGTVALVRGARPGPTILIRADMDGLPILEENRVAYASTHRGAMHA